VRAIPPPPRVTPDESEYQTGLREPATPLWLQPNASPVQTSDHIEPEAPSWGSPPVDSTGSTRLRRLAPVLVGLLVAVVALAGGAAWFATRHDPVASGPASMTGAGDAGTNAPSTSASSSASTSASTSASASTTSDSSASEEPASTEPSDDDDAELTDEEAHQRLDELADEGLSDVSLDGQDVAMIASKWDGVVDPLQKTAKGRHRFYYVDILAEHDRLADEDNLGARVVMLRGSDYGKRASSPDGQEIYVTLALGDFGSPREVRTWCNDRFADLSRKKRDNQCVATKLTD
ncbi:MAG TPA: hypothetical protein VF635_00090, partial [Propionibacteriaceae bacterium]